MVPRPSWLVRLAAKATTKRQKDAVRYWSNVFRATPPWLTREHKRLISRIKQDAKSRGLVVDHIVPLDGKIVCGLHVPWNMRAVSVQTNRAKSNVTWPGCPYEQQVIVFKPRQLEFTL